MRVLQADEARVRQRTDGGGGGERDGPNRDPAGSGRRKSGETERSRRRPLYCAVGVRRSPQILHTREHGDANALAAERGPGRLAQALCAREPKRGAAVPECPRASPTRSCPPAHRPRARSRIRRRRRRRAVCAFPAVPTTAAGFSTRAPFPGKLERVEIYQEREKTL